MAVLPEFSVAVIDGVGRGLTVTVCEPAVETGVELPLPGLMSFTKTAVMPSLFHNCVKFVPSLAHHLFSKARDTANQRCDVLAEIVVDGIGNNFV